MNAEKQQFTQQSAPQQRAQNDAYCPITSMTCATVLLMLKSGCWYPITFENFVIVLINDVKGIVNGFTILLVLSITVQDWPECKNHTQFDTKMTKIDTLFLIKMSLKNHTLWGWTYPYIPFKGVQPSLLGQNQREVSQIKTFRSVLMCNELVNL